MGTWGDGTFENDTACDFAGNLFDMLKNAIARDLQNAGSDGLLERPTVAIVAVIRVLCEQLPIEPDICKAEVQEWWDSYRSWFAVNFDKEKADSAIFQNAEREFSSLLSVVPNDECGPSFNDLLSS